MLFSLFICGLLPLVPPVPPVTLAAPAGRRVVVRPWLGAAPLVAEGAAACTSAHDEVQISTFRCYLSGLTLRFADGTLYRDPAVAHLIEADDSASWVVALPAAPAGSVTELTFVLGVDSVANVAGALGGALDPARGMYWAWQSGYINAKVEGTSPSRPASARRAFAFHLGGYRAPYATLRAVALPLARPSAATTLTVLADVDRWLGAAPLADTPDVVIPGAAAAALADRATQMFRWPTPAETALTE